MNDFQPRADQKRVLAYTGGKMGVTAVPGSGKTHTLAVLAAQLVSAIDSDQEVLIVTLVNSAVDNFKQRINQLIKRQRLLAGFGYRVRTLHGLAHDIVRERPGLVGLAEDFQIIDERRSDDIREDAVDAWLRGHPEAPTSFLALDELDAKQIEWIKRSHWPNLVRDLAAAFIKRAKDLQLTPEVLLERLPLVRERWTPSQAVLVSMGVEIYANYQRSLAYQGAVDFDDLIRLALEVLRRDPAYLDRLRRRWPYILEDEAQDSSKLQEEILRLLAGESGNWVRVGDPNQAIYETFTNANPRFLREFLEEPGVTRVTLSASGRSQPAIIELANYLVQWTQTQHPTEEVRGSFLPQLIMPTSADDLQRNPPAAPHGIQLVLQPGFSSERELRFVADSLARWLPEHQDCTVAVLVPRNERGFELINLLKQRKIPYVELLRSTSTTRQTAEVLEKILRCLAEPTSARKLSEAFRVWCPDDPENPEIKARIDRIARRIAGCPAVEAYLWPRADLDWLTTITPELSPEDVAWLLEFREAACRWHRAAILPIDQLILTLANDRFREAKELALAYKLALLLRDLADSYPTYRLAEFVEELAVIARNERRFLGLAEEDTGFEPPQGKVTVATMHKAKGLEWDRVYLMSVNNYDFPSGQAHDTYIAEKWFVRDGLNLEAEALALLATMAGDFSNPDAPADQFSVPEGQATRQARLDYVSERLRLLYVGITRAKQELIVTWNTGRSDRKLQPAVPLIALHGYWQQKQSQEENS